MYTQCNDCGIIVSHLLNCLKNPRLKKCSGDKMYLYTASAPTLLAQTETPQVQCMVFPHVS